MKVTEQTKSPAPPVGYPRLMRSRLNGQVVLFVAPNSGTVVLASTTGAGASLGYYSEAWVHATDSTAWALYNGYLVLEN